MRILQVGKFYPPHPGGIETFLKNLSEGLSESGLDIYVLCAASRKSSSVEKVSNLTLERVFCLGTLFSQPIAPLLFLKMLFLARKYDIVHIHSPHPLTELCCLFLPKQIPVIVSYHSDVVRQKLMLPFYKPLLHSFLKLVKKIVVATEYHHKYSAYLPAYEDKCAVVPYGITTNHLKKNDEVEKSIKEIKNKYSSYILFVGRLVGYKGINYLIDAMQNLDTNLVIVGEGPLEGELKQQASRLQLGSKVHFVGKVTSDADFAAFYHSCDLLVLPSISKNEAFGIVMIEAMACGKPVISSRLNSGISIVNKDGVTGLQVEPCDSDALALAIKKLLSDESLRKQMGADALTRFKENYSREATVSSYKKIYQEILSDSE